MRDLDGEEFSAHGVDRDAGRVLVMDIHKGAAADKDGFLPGDLIQSVNRTPVKTVSKMIDCLRNTPPDKDILIGIVRTQQPASIVICAGAEPPQTAVPK